MNVPSLAGRAPSSIAAAIGDPARARMLYTLLDDRARTSTELAVIAGVSASTASVHLHRLTRERLVDVQVQGKCRYYRLTGADVARVLESLNVLAGAPRGAFVPNTPQHLRFARTCYDHLAGSLGVMLHDRLASMGWWSTGSRSPYTLTERGVTALEALGVDAAEVQARRRRPAFACLDWSERRPHVGGAVGAELLRLALKRRWLTPQIDSRALGVTELGRREFLTRFGLRVPAIDPPVAHRLTPR